MTNPMIDRARLQRSRFSAEKAEGLSAPLYTQEEAVALTVANLKEILRKSPQIIRGYTTYLSALQGKLLRAQSVLACAQNAEGKIPQNSIIIATAIELLHLATLVHDDVIDQADLRRGKPTLRFLHGNKTAVICGDFLLSQCIRLISTLQDPENFLEWKFQDYLANVCLGELNQYLNNNNFNLTPLQYFKIINGKTAALFEASFLAGAVTGGEPDSVWNLYRLLGHYIGMIFQLNDDCRDFESDIDSSGKNVQSDYEQDVITLPLIFTFANDEPFKSLAVATHGLGKKLPRTEINEAVRRNQGLTMTHRIARWYGKKAWAILEELPVSPQKHDLLNLLIQKAISLS